MRNGFIEKVSKSLGKSHQEHSTISDASRRKSLGIISSFQQFMTEDIACYIEGSKV